MTNPPEVLEASHVDLVGYHDLAGRPGFKLALQEANGSWFLYMGHLWDSGWSILDVTEPSEPRLIRFIEGPPNTWTLQIQVAAGKMLTALEKPLEGWGMDPNGPYEEGAYIWDVKRDPTNPTLLGQYRTNGTGTHRNFYAGGSYAYMTSAPDGFAGHMLCIVDVSEPSRPREVSRWWWPGQHVAEGEMPEYGFYMHGPAYVEGDKAYLSYGRVGMVILDVSNVFEPQLISRVSFGDLGSWLGCHSVVPMTDRGIAIVNSEAILEGAGDPLNYTAVVDISDLSNPKIMSMFPLPVPTPELGYGNYYEKGGRFGPHNQHHHQGQPALEKLGHFVPMTYFNAGLRIFEISDPYVPEEVGHFVPADPQERRGNLPQEALVTQFEDVLVDARGFIYCTDKNHGLFVLRYSEDL